MTLSPGPPPWPIPPSWTLTPPAAPDDSERTVVVLAPDGIDLPGVDVRRVPAPAAGFAGVYALAETVAQVEGAAVLACRVEAPAETAWALDLLHAGSEPLALAASAADVTDAIAVAAAAPAGSGCLLVTRGEIHAARHAGSAGPMGHVTDGAVHLLWRAPERLTVRGPHGTGTPRVALHTVTLGDDGELVRLVAGQSDGLVVSCPGAVPEAVGKALAEIRIPVVLASAAPYEGPLTTTGLDPLKARVLMYLLLAAGRDHDAVLAAFTAEGPAEL